GIGNSIEIKSDRLDAVVALSTDRCFPGHEIAISLDLRVKPGWHVYGKPLASNYQAIELELQGPLIGEQSLELPAPQQMHLKALNETLPVYSGEVRAVGKVGIKWSPPMPAKFLEPLGDLIKPGSYSIRGTLRFQACSDTVCESPQAITFDLPLTITPRVPPAPKKSG
ncbi:MAG: protein-disulfide reductase DsbD domain-containing protein, partial [Candidatus Binataceae bacterium]